MMGTLLQLFWTFFTIGLFNFGGGGAMLSLIQAQVVTRFGWITEGQFTDIVAISQTTPGPIGINCATYVGYEVGGVIGSMTSTFALVLPSFLIFYGIITLYNKYRTSAMFENVMTGLRPAVAGLIGAAAFILIFKVDFPGISVLKDNFPDWTSWAILAASMCASLFFKVNPILLILAGGLIGFLIY
ncbi:MAG: chromate transporter [Bacteroidales bacterium]|nr:chromate transporter [Bacteroidales bacterium]